MKFTVVIDAQNNPNEVGELLRGLFFKQNREKGELGCYSSFDLQDGVEELPKTLVDEEEEDDQWKLYWSNFQKTIEGKTIKMSYYWDGDGELVFFFEDGSALVNSDCKKDYYWEYYKSYDLKTGNEL